MDVRSGSSRELVQDHKSSRECTSKRGITAAPRAEDAQEVGRPGAIGNAGKMGRRDEERGPCVSGGMWL